MLQIAPKEKAARRSIRGVLVFRTPHFYMHTTRTKSTRAAHTCAARAPPWWEMRALLSCEGCKLYTTMPPCLWLLLLSGLGGFDSLLWWSLQRRRRFNILLVAKCRSVRELLRRQVTPS